MSVVLWGAVLAVFGWVALPFLLIQAVYGFSLLEVVNYLEHYGLLRRTLPDGRVERCMPEYSWNSNHMVTNLFLYHLQRHSDHHANPTRHYQALRYFEESPQLPAGDAAMILLATSAAVVRRDGQARYPSLPWRPEPHQLVRPTPCGPDDQVCR